MADIQNERDLFLQSEHPRFIPPPIDPARIPGLPGAFSNIGQLQQDVEDLGEQINHLMNTSASFFIRAPALAFFGAAGTTTPATITLTAERGTGLVGGTITWSVVTGSATISPSSGDSTVVTGSSVTGRSVTIRARLTIDWAVYDAYVTITRFGAVSAADKIDLTNQVTGSLAAGNVSGLGALAFLNTVNLNTQTTGALNGLTQVTNLGNLAYANSIAANQIGAGTLAAGVVYAGEINADNITSGTITGRTMQTSATYPRVVIDSSNNSISLLDGPGSSAVRINDTGMEVIDRSGFLGPAVHIAKTSGTQPSLRVSRSQTNGGIVVSQPVGGSTQPPITIDMGTSLPTARPAGGICFFDGWLCFADGMHWFRSDGTRLT